MLKCFYLNVFFSPWTKTEIFSWDNNKIAPFCFAITPSGRKTFRKIPHPSQDENWASCRPRLDHENNENCKCKRKMPFYGGFVSSSTWSTLTKNLTAHLLLTFVTLPTLKDHFVCWNFLPFQRITIKRLATDYDGAFDCFLKLNPFELLQFSKAQKVAPLCFSKRHKTEAGKNCSQHQVKKGWQRVNEPKKVWAKSKKAQTFNQFPSDKLSLVIEVRLHFLAHHIFISRGNIIGK